MVLDVCSVFQRCDIKQIDQVLEAVDTFWLIERTGRMCGWKEEEAKLGGREMFK